MRVAVIPARGGSRRVPHKNVKEFRGKPIIAYSIETALKSCLFDAGVWVSTDDRAIAEVAMSFGAMVHNRAEAYAKNEVGTQEVMAIALSEIFPCRVDLPASACCIYATAPMLRVEDLRRGLSVLDSSLMPYVYSTDQQGNDAGQFYWGWTRNFIAGVALESFGRPLRMPNERVCDINTLDDWIRAERMYAALNEEETRGKP